MPIVPTAVLPKRIPHGPLKPSTAMQVSPLLLEAAGSEADEALKKLQSSKEGLSGAESARRLKEYGPNVVAREARHSHLRLLAKALINPLVILLLVIAASSFLTGDFRAGIVVLLVVILGGTGKKIQLWDPATGKETGNWLADAEQVTSLAFSRDGKVFAYGSRDGRVRFYDAVTGKAIAPGKEPEK